MKCAAQGSQFFLVCSWEWNFCPLDLSCSKKHRTKANLKSDPQRNKWQAHSLLFMYGAQRALEMVGIFCWTFSFFNSAWVLWGLGICFSSGSSICPSWKTLWLAGKPIHEGTHESEMGRNEKSWVVGGVIFSKRQPGFCLLLNFIPACPVLCATRFTHWIMLSSRIHKLA